MVKNAIRTGIIFIIISSFVFTVVPLHTSALLDNSLSLDFDKAVENGCFTKCEWNCNIFRYA